MRRGHLKGSGQPHILLDPCHSYPVSVSQEGLTAWIEGEVSASLQKGVMSIALKEVAIYPHHGPRGASIAIGSVLTFLLEGQGD